jgi:hypothetical protein
MPPFFAFVRVYSPSFAVKNREPDAQKPKNPLGIEAKRLKKDTLEKGWNGKGAKGLWKKLKDPSPPSFEGGRTLPSEPSKD